MMRLFPLTTRSARRRGFTLVELLVAVVVLIVILLAVSKIFQTASQVTAIGQGAEDVMQDITAIERLMRDDIANLSYEGVFAIRSYSIPNNINGNVLLNPTLDPDARIRCDQLLFFRNGLQGAQTIRVGSSESAKGEMLVSRVYWGHAFQLEDWDAFAPANTIADRGDAYDVDPDADVFPWSTGNATPYETNFAPVGGNPDGTDIFSSNAAGAARSINQPEAREWILARQNCLLANDDQRDPDTNSKTVYLGTLQTARSVFLDDPLAGECPQLRDGRVDAAATTLRDIRERLLVVSDGLDADDIWPEQRQFILDEMLYYPRAEKYPPSGHRVDQALGNHVLSSACSDIRIEWTYKPGVGGLGYRCNSDFAYSGYIPPADDDGNERETIWFGMDELGVDLPPQYRTRPLDHIMNAFSPLELGLETLEPENIENYYSVNVNGQQVQVYQAVFGFNQTQPFMDDNGWPSPTGCIPDDVNHDFGYTPWPSAIRVTMTLHDPDIRLEGGRTVQFVIPLPRRGGL